MDSVFIYWDNSNIFHEAQRLAEQRQEGPEARWRVRINFESLLRLAHADRKLQRALAAGSIPPEMRHLWNHLEARDVEAELVDRGVPDSVPDFILQLQLRMMEDAVDYSGDPGIAVMVTGDGAGWDLEDEGVHRTLERMHGRGWRIEIFSWKHSCNPRMMQWAEQHGIFVALDDFYEAITFLEPSKPGYELAPPRDSAELDLSRRAFA